MSEYQKSMYMEIFKKVSKDTIFFIVRYQRVYINTCWYEEVYK